MGSARAFILLMDWGDVAPNLVVCFFPSDVCDVEDVEDVVDGVGECGLLLGGGFVGGALLEPPLLLLLFC